MEVPRLEPTVKNKPMNSLTTSSVLASKSCIIHRLYLKAVYVEKRLG